MKFIGDVCYGKAKHPEQYLDIYLPDSKSFNVLRERGVDSARVIVDDAAPLYHIGVKKEYPPMLFIVSDNDMPNRFEQTQLVLSTLKHLGYDEEKIYYKLMHGTHCQYSHKEEFGKMVCEFIENNK